MYDIHKVVACTHGVIK
ncbi:hypothetical protein GBAR_LOCUS11248 [Geodia barretti]|uniref:Uncharacterized protein n=1 Tax=Geodia barretti TaxID=519541 RepID=A0AA35RY27_GEOBA|nr:hypothetical protein GBAR_LOCUS11248 [Geodia barretti]